MEKRVGGSNATIETPVMCAVFSWSTVCGVGDGIVCAGFSEGLS